MDLSSLMQSLGPLQESMKAKEAEKVNDVFEGKVGGGAVSP